MRRVWLMASRVSADHVGGAMSLFDLGRFLQVEPGTKSLARAAQDEDALIFGSALALSSAAVSSIIRSIVRALRRSGRFRVTSGDAIFLFDKDVRHDE